MAEIHETIDRLLEERGISGAKMSSDLGMSRSFMTELRKGRAKSITMETAQKIADYFGVSLDSLLGFDELYEDGSFNSKFSVVKRTANNLPSTGSTRKRAKLNHLRSVTGTKYTPPLEPQKSNYVFISYRSGEVESRKLTEQQLNALKAILAQMPDAPEEE